MFSVRLVTADSYQAQPLPQLDPTFSEFRGSEIKHVPVIRVFGTTPDGQKTCLHVHGVFPYLFIPYTGEEDPNVLAYRLAASLDAAINVSLGAATSNTQHVYSVQRVSGIPFYGYHKKEHQFLKIYFYNPAMIKRAADLLQNGSVLNQSLQPHEAHINYILQFMMDYNIYGMSLVNMRRVAHRRTAPSLNELSSSGQSSDSVMGDTVYLPTEIERQSTCELEVDALSADILNRLDIEKNLELNPGLAAIWEEERARRAQAGFTGGDSQLVNPKSPPRPTFQPTDNDVYQEQRLARRLLMISQCDESTLSTGSNRSVAYAAETRDDENLLDASRLPSVSLQRVERLNPAGQDESLGNISYADSSPNPASQNFIPDSSILGTDDMQLVDMLAQLARETETFPETVDADSLLGSQVSLQLNGNEDKSDNEEEEAVDLNLTCFELDALGSIEAIVNRREKCDRDKNLIVANDEDESSLFSSPRENSSSSVRLRDEETRESSRHRAGFPQYDGAGDVSPTLLNSDREESSDDIPSNGKDYDRTTDYNDFADMRGSMEIGILLSSGDDNEKSESLDAGSRDEIRSDNCEEDVDDVADRETLPLEALLNGDPCFTESAVLDKSDLAELRDQYASLLDNALLPEVRDASHIDVLEDSSTTFAVATGVVASFETIEKSCGSPEAADTPDILVESTENSSEIIVPDAKERLEYVEEKSEESRSFSKERGDARSNDTADYNCNVAATWEELQNLRPIDKLANDPKYNYPEAGNARYMPGPRSKRRPRRSSTPDRTARLHVNTKETTPHETGLGSPYASWITGKNLQAKRIPISQAEDTSSRVCDVRRSMQISHGDSCDEDAPRETSDEPLVRSIIDTGDSLTDVGNTGAPCLSYSSDPKEPPVEPIPVDFGITLDASDPEHSEKTLGDTCSTSRTFASYYATRRSSSLQETEEHRHCFVSKYNSIVQDRVFASDRLWIIQRRKRGNINANLRDGTLICKSQDCKLPVVFLEKLADPRKPEYVVEKTSRDEDSTTRRETTKESSVSMSIAMDPSSETARPIEKPRRTRAKREIPITSDEPNDEKIVAPSDALVSNGSRFRDSSVARCVRRYRAVSCVARDPCNPRRRGTLVVPQFVRQRRRNARIDLENGEKNRSGRKKARARTKYKEGSLPGIPGIPATVNYELPEKRRRRRVVTVSSNVRDQEDPPKPEPQSKVFSTWTTRPDSSRYPPNGIGKKSSSNAPRYVDVPPEKLRGRSVRVGLPVKREPGTKNSREKDTARQVNFSPTGKSHDARTIENGISLTSGQKELPETVALSLMLRDAKSPGTRKALKLLLQKRLSEKLDGEKIAKPIVKKFQSRDQKSETKVDDTRVEKTMSEEAASIRSEVTIRAEVPKLWESEKMKNSMNSSTPADERVTEPVTTSRSDTISIASLHTEICEPGEFDDRATALSVEFTVEDTTDVIFDSETPNDSIIVGAANSEECNNDVRITYDTDRYENAIKEANFFAGKDYTIDAVSDEIPTCLFEEDSNSVDKAKASDVYDRDSELSVDPRDLDVYDVESLTSTGTGSALDETTEIIETSIGMSDEDDAVSVFQDTGTTHSVLSEDDADVENSANESLDQESSLEEDSPSFEALSPKLRVPLESALSLGEELAVPSSPESAESSTSTDGIALADIHPEHAETDEILQNSIGEVLSVGSSTSLVDSSVIEKEISGENVSTESSRMMNDESRMTLMNLDIQSLRETLADSHTSDHVIPVAKQMHNRNDQVNAHSERPELPEIPEPGAPIECNVTESQQYSERAPISIDPEENRLPVTASREMEVFRIVEGNEKRLTPGKKLGDDTLRPERQDQTMAESEKTGHWKTEPPGTNEEIEEVEVPTASGEGKEVLTSARSDLVSLALEQIAELPGPRGKGPEFSKFLVEDKHSGLNTSATEGHPEAQIFVEESHEVSAHSETYVESSTMVEEVEELPKSLENRSKVHVILENGKELLSTILNPSIQLEETGYALEKIEVSLPGSPIEFDDSMVLQEPKDLPAPSMKLSEIIDDVNCKEKAMNKKLAEFPFWSEDEDRLDRVKNDCVDINENDVTSAEIDNGETFSKDSEHGASEGESSPPMSCRPISIKLVNIDWSKIRPLAANTSPDPEAPIQESSFIIAQSNEEKGKEISVKCSKISGEICDPETLETIEIVKNVEDSASPKTEVVTHANGKMRRRRGRIPKDTRMPERRSVRICAEMTLKLSQQHWPDITKESMKRPTDTSGASLKGGSSIVSQNSTGKVLNESSLSKMIRRVRTRPKVGQNSSEIEVAFGSPRGSPVRKSATNISQELVLSEQLIANGNASKGSLESSKREASRKCTRAQNVPASPRITDENTAPISNNHKNKRSQINLQEGLVEFESAKTIMADDALKDPKTESKTATQPIEFDVMIARPGNVNSKKLSIRAARGRRVGFKIAKSSRTRLRLSSVRPSGKSTREDSREPVTTDRQSTVPVILAMSTPGATRNVTEIGKESLPDVSTPEATVEPRTAVQKRRGRSEKSSDAKSDSLMGKSVNNIADASPRRACSLEAIVQDSETPTKRKACPLPSLELRTDPKASESSQQRTTDTRPESGTPVTPRKRGRPRKYPKKEIIASEKTSADVISRTLPQVQESLGEIGCEHDSKVSQKCDLIQSIAEDKTKVFHGEETSVKQIAKNSREVVTENIVPARRKRIYRRRRKHWRHRKPKPSVETQNQPEVTHAESTIKEKTDRDSESTMTMPRSDSLDTAKNLQESCPPLVNFSPSDALVTKPGNLSITKKRVRFDEDSIARSAKDYQDSLSREEVPEPCRKKNFKDPGLYSPHPGGEVFRVTSESPSGIVSESHVSCLDSMALSMRLAISGKDRRNEDAADENKDPEKPEVSTSSPRIEPTFDFPSSSRRTRRHGKSLPTILKTRSPLGRDACVIHKDEKPTFSRTKSPEASEPAWQMQNLRISDNSTGSSTGKTIVYAQLKRPMILLKRLTRKTLNDHGIDYRPRNRKFVRIPRETYRNEGSDADDEFQLPAYDGAADLSSSDEDKDVQENPDFTIARDEKRICAYGSTSTKKKDAIKQEECATTPKKRKNMVTEDSSSPSKKRVTHGTRATPRKTYNPSPVRASTLKTPGSSNARIYSPLKIIVTSPKVRNVTRETRSATRDRLHDNVLRYRLLDTDVSSQRELGDGHASETVTGAVGESDEIRFIEQTEQETAGSASPTLRDGKDVRKKLFFPDKDIETTRTSVSLMTEVQETSGPSRAYLGRSTILEDHAESNGSLKNGELAILDTVPGPSRSCDDTATRGDTDQDDDDNDICDVTFTQYIESQRCRNDVSFTSHRDSLEMKERIIIRPKFNPPTRRRVSDTMGEYGLPKYRNVTPFFSVSADVPRQKELVQKMLRVPGKCVDFLSSFVPSVEGVTGLARWRKMWLNEFHPSLAKSKDYVIRIALTRVNERVLATPLARPPTRKQVKDWLRARVYLATKRDAAGEPTKIVDVRQAKKKSEVPEKMAQPTVEDSKSASLDIDDLHEKSMDPDLLKVPGVEDKNDQSDTSDVSIVEPSPERTLVFSDPEKITRSAIRTKLAKKRLYEENSGIAKSLGDNTNNSPRSCETREKSTLLSNDGETNPSLLEVLEKSRLFRDRDGSRHLGISRGQIEFFSQPTRSNVTRENLQNAKALTRYQYLTIMCLEVHVVTRGDLLPDAQHDPIAAIFYSVQNDVPPTSSIKPLEHGAIVLAEDDRSKNKMYYTYASKMPWEVYFASNEEALLNSLVTLITRTDPEILIGWELETLSWGYVFQRASRLGTNLFKRVSRIPATQYTWEFQAPDIETLAEVKLPGRIVLDIWRIMRHEAALLSYTFESVMHHVLNERIPCPTFKTLTEWWDLARGRPRRWRVVEHYCTRVLGVFRILDQLDIIGRTSELARLFGIQFYEVFSRGSQFRVESVMLRLAKPLNYIAVSPSAQQRASMRAMEALPLIMEPESMLYCDPLIVLDFQSLYPSIIIAHNYCFSTCLGRIEHIGQPHPFEFGAYTLRVPKRTALRLQGKVNYAPCGVAYVKPEVRLGILPRMLTEILETRFMVKKAMKDHDKKDKTLQRALHSRQMGLKFLANVTYGYTAANFSGRMPCIEVGDSVISKSKETLERAIKLVEMTPKWGARVVYGDTDSLFILVPGRSKDEAFVIGNEIADAVTASNPPPIKLKFEKILYPAILQTKKRYCGYMYETPEQEKPTYLAKGIETVRRDGCPAVSKILEKTLKILFDTKDVSLVKKYVTRQLDKVLRCKVSIQDLTFAKEFRGLKGYKVKACVPALELTRRLMRKDPRALPRTSERVRYVIVAGAPNQALIHCVRTPWELMNDPGLRPNAIYYVTRVIIPPLNRCLNLMGVDVNEWYREMPHRQILENPFGQPTDKQKLTIFQYFGTIVCVACGQPSNKGVCAKCLDRPADTLVAINEKLRWLDGTYNRVTAICQSCIGQADAADCASLDCPVLYRRAQAQRELTQAAQLREIIECGNNLEF